MLSSVCVETYFHTEINSSVVLTEAHNKASMVTDWQQNAVDTVNQL